LGAERRFVLVAVFAVAVACLGDGVVRPARVSADVSTRIVVTVQGSSRPPFSISYGDAEAAMDVTREHVTTNPVDPEYRYYEGSITGVSVAQIGELAGIARDSLDDVSDAATVTYDRYTWQLSRSEVLDGFPHVNAADPVPNYAVIAPAGANDGFEAYRPMRSSTDDNLDDAFTIGTSGQVDVALRVVGGILDVGTTAATPASTKINQSVSFSTPTVTLNGHAPVGNLTYTWYFGDTQTTASGASPSHAYTDPGSWLARVEVTDEGGNSGVSLPVRVQVDDAAADPDPGDGSGGGGPGGPAQGPGGDPRHTTGGGTGPSSGAASGAQKGSPTTSASGGAGGHGSAAGSHSLSLSTGGGAGGSGAGGHGDEHGSNAGSAGGIHAGGIPAAGGIAAYGAGAEVPQSKRVAPAAKDLVPIGLTGVLIDASGRALPLSALANLAASTHAKAAPARASVGGGSKTSWLGWLLQAAGVVFVIALGGLRDLELRSRHRRLVWS
jgi:hypothetical protein